MADLSGLVISALAISFEIASTLYSYGKEVKGARKDIRSISNELFGLIGVLEHLKLQSEHGLDDEVTLVDASEFTSLRSSTDLSDQSKGGNPANTAREVHRNNVSSVLIQTLEFLQELQQTLHLPRGRLAAAVNLMKWPLQQGDMAKHLKRLERVKSYFVLSLVADEVDLSRRTADEITDLRTMMQEASHEQNIAKIRKEYAEIIGWLSPVDPSITRTSMSRTRAPGSGVWFMRTEAFKIWRESSTSSTFWLNGITGAGKSTLMTAVVEELLPTRGESYDLAYFYCSFSNDQTLHTQNILGSLLAQICPNSAPLYEEIQSIYVDVSAKTLGKPPRPEMDVLSNLLVRQAEKRPLYILIDGINECGQPHEILQTLASISKSASNIRIFLSSINEKGIGDYIQAMPALSIENLRPQDIRPDITLLVHSTLETQPRLKQLSSDLKDDIVWALGEGAQGMFRWAQCQLDALSKLRTPGAVRKALKSLPPTLDKAYEEMLLRIDGEEDMELTRTILQFLAFSLQPLSLHEVCTALQITPGMLILDDSKCLTHPRDILGICGGLLKYNENTGIVTLAHHSVKTYLMSGLQGKVARFRLDEKEAHRMLALYCLTYLSYDTFSGDECLLVGEDSDHYVDCHFLDYAVQQWPIHIQAAGEPSGKLWIVLRSFLLSADSGRHNFLNWVQLLIPGSDYSKNTPPLYYASSFGLTTAVRYLLEMGVDIEQRGGRGGATPINIAAFRGHLDVVKLLLEHGADPLKPDIETDLNAVQWAKYKSHWSVLWYFQSMGYIFNGATWIKDAKLVLVNGTWRLNKPATSQQEMALDDLDPQAGDAKDLV